MAHVYLKGGGSWRSEEPSAEQPELRAALLREPAVDLLLTRTETGVRVDSRHGEALIGRHNGLLSYRRLEGDPLSLGADLQDLDFAQALNCGIDGPYPDALVQATQICDSRRSGDLIVSAGGGFDLRERVEHPEHHSSHGSLSREHMMVPFASSLPLSGGPARSADIASTVVAALGHPSGALPSSAGRSLLE